MNKLVIATVGLLAGIGIVAKSQAPEVKRYLKVMKM
jgi:hypothetical protein